MRRKIDEVEGLKLFEAPCFPDGRGYLLQSYLCSDLERRGLPSRFRQAIQSKSKCGTVRGLHFQWDRPQGKLIRCVAGRIFDVAVDIRRSSQTLGDYVAVEMSDTNRLVFWLPPGFAHGFMALEEETIVLYECTEEWNPAGEAGILWSDPALGIHWPDVPALVSAKDTKNPTLAQWLSTPRSSAFSLSRR
ncbi:MAG TPA: dTDP-4-dehydrorhamnose 3,5-epimerase [Acidobacteriota bacterium]|nr:dTDP-4-dehydrorhamnose 3,5-epimerase [Acidobacteriota bacterium]